MADSVPAVINGVISYETPAQVQSLFSGKTFTATTNFSFEWNGDSTDYQAGLSYEGEPALITAMLAAGAPITQP